jgi:hypothetical protein
MSRAASAAARQRADDAAPTAESVLAIRKMGSGHQYEIRWNGLQETSWEPASRVRKEIPALLLAFEAAQQQLLQQQQQAADNATDGEEGAAEGGAMDDEEPAADGSSMRAQMEAMQQLLREQAQQLQQLRSTPAHSPPLPAQPSPAAAAAAAPAAAEPPSRFARKEPRAQDLCEYDGAAGAKLDDWLKQLAMAARLYHLNAQEAVDFAGSRLRGAALDWWLELSPAELAAVGDTGALAGALRTRFQPVTAARTAREQLDKLQQGSRGVNEYIADFQRLTTQIGMTSLGEENALFAFERGLRRELAVELRRQGVATLKEAIALVARVGGLLQASAGSLQGRGAAANQMDVDDGHGSAARLDRIEAALNAMTSGAHSGNSAGMGAKTQTQRGYQQERGAGGRGGHRGGRFGRGGARDDPPRIPNVPGVPAQLVEQRRAAGQCYRCGASDHTRFECTKASSATNSQPSF